MDASEVSIGIPTNHEHSIVQNSNPNGTVIAPLIRPIEQVAQAVAEFDADAAPSMIRHAEVLIDHREFSSAQSVLRHVLAINSRHERGVELLAIALERAGRMDQALRCRKALTRISPLVIYKLDLAALQYRLEDDQAALTSYQDILATDSVPEERLFEVYKNLGNIHVRIGDFEAAEDFYNRAFVLDPKSDVLLVNFGTLEINRDNLEAATERFRGAIDANDKNDRAWVGLALVHRARGDFELSWGNLERALDLAPSNRTAIKLLVEWAVRDGRVSSIIGRLQEHVDCDQEDAEMAFQLAKCLTLLGRLNEALLECERVVALDPEQEEAFRLRRVLAEKVLAETNAGL